MEPRENDDWQEEEASLDDLIADTRYEERADDKRITADLIAKGLPPF